MYNLPAIIWGSYKYIIIFNFYTSLRGRHSSFLQEISTGHLLCTMHCFRHLEYITKQNKQMKVSALVNHFNKSRKIINSICKLRNMLNGNKCYKNRASKGNKGHTEKEYMRKKGRKFDYGSWRRHWKQLCGSWEPLESFEDRSEIFYLIFKRITGLLCWKKTVKGHVRRQMRDKLWGYWSNPMRDNSGLDQSGSSTGSEKLTYFKIYFHILQVELDKILITNWLWE